MAFILEIIRLGIKNLGLHKLRSTLTSLGIILGVAAVIVVVAIILDRMLNVGTRK